MSDDTSLWRLLAKAAERITPDEFEDYFALRQLLTSKRPADQQEFLERFVTYYRMRIGGLTPEFFSQYFELLFSCRPLGIADPYSEILLRLYKLPRRKGDFALQPSFVSKLVSIHDESRPIFDRHVSGFFGVRVPTVGSVEVRIAGFVANLRRVQSDYECWAAEERFDSIKDSLFRKQPKLSDCHPTRICDFLVWTVGARHIT